ncbi:MAG: benzoate-CoA ligase family protein [Acidimicrobiia bacterium]|nr:benzoate-CoA ligase family protein [Acidimicrobiia bacterium]
MFNASTWLVDRHVDDGRGDQVAIRCLGASVTYRDLRDLIERTAGALRAVGVQPEQRVAMVMLDSVEFVATFLGAMRIGAVPLAVNPLLPGRDLGAIAGDARARIVVVSGDRAASIADLVAAAPEVELVVVTDTEDGSTPDVEIDADGVDTTTWFALLSNDGDGSPFSTWSESPGFWLCTSGSTGQPKLAMHRHIDIKVTCDTFADHVLGVRPDDRFYSVGPMFHAYGLGNSISFPFSVGATTILVPTRPPTPKLVVDTMAAEAPTLFFCIPTFYAALNNAGVPADAFASVRLAASAAEPLPAETFERFREQFGVTILDGIGSTEMLHIYLSNSEADLRPGTSGVPVPGYELKLIDDNGDVQVPGEPGQLCVSGASAATGYWCRFEQSRATFRGPWMYTGDLYDRSEDGFYTYMGRVDDMLRVGGEWVSPAEVEGVLIQYETVLEAAVVGERDEAGILRPIAFVIPVDGKTVGSDELDRLCREHLAGYKRPKRYEIVADLPKTATGKIQRFKLRA